MLKNTSFRSKKKVRVFIQLEDGANLDGHVFCSTEQRVSDLLNDDREFLPFEDLNEEITILRKGTISRINLKEGGVAKKISNNPYTILGVKQGATREEIKAAYHERVKAYHPDRIVSLSLPDDMTNFANDMLSRINAAYDSLIKQVDTAAE